LPPPAAAILAALDSDAAPLRLGLGFATTGALLNHRAQTT
jgi:hypothetical protein